jgi:tetrahydromethanopterin S-methyltransferase subunit G
MDDEFKESTERLEEIDERNLQEFHHDEEYVGKYE